MRCWKWSGCCWRWRCSSVAVVHGRRALDQLSGRWHHSQGVTAACADSGNGPGIAQRQAVIIGILLAAGGTAEHRAGVGWVGADGHAGGNGAAVAQSQAAAAAVAAAAGIAERHGADDVVAGHRHRAAQSQAAHPATVLRLEDTSAAGQHRTGAAVAPLDAAGQALVVGIITIAIAIQGAVIVAHAGAVAGLGAPGHASAAVDRCGVLDGDTVAGAGAATIAVINTDRALHLVSRLAGGRAQTQAGAAAQGGALGQILPGVAEVRLS